MSDRSRFSKVWRESDFFNLGENKMIQQMMVDLRPGRDISILALVCLILAAVFAVGALLSFILARKKRALQLGLGVPLSAGLLAMLIVALVDVFSFADFTLFSLFIFMVILGIIAIVVIAKLKGKVRIAAVVFAPLLLASLSVLLYATVLDPVPSFRGDDGGNLLILMGLLAIALAVLLIGIIIAVNHKVEPLSFSTKDIAVAGVLLALAIGLSFVGVRMPQGGRVTLASSLPIMIYCYFFGLRKGSVMVLAFLGFQFIQGPWILHVWSAMLDYVVPYLALIFFGVFSMRRFRKDKTLKRGFGLKNHGNFFIAFALYLVVRYASHVLSGAIFFGEFAPDGHSAISWAFLYNTFFIVDAAIALAGGALLLMSNTFSKFMNTGHEPKVVGDGEASSDQGEAV